MTMDTTTMQNKEWRTKVPAEIISDSYNVFKWPEYIALIEKLQPSCDYCIADSTQFSLVLEIDDAYVKTKFEKKHLPISGFEVYRWPEFIAFCKRAGIYYGAFTKDMTIRICDGECPVVFHTYIFSKDEEEADHAHTVSGSPSTD